MEIFVLGALGLVGLAVVGAFVAAAGFLWWLITLPFRIVFWVLAAVCCVVAFALLLPLLAVAFVVLLVLSPLILLACLIGCFG